MRTTVSPKQENVTLDDGHIDRNMCVGSFKELLRKFKVV
jgi:hypothetical protein